jgi:hypothetical protein
MAGGEKFCTPSFSVSLLLLHLSERRELENSKISCWTHSVVVVPPPEDEVPSPGIKRASAGDSTGGEDRNESRLCVGDSGLSSPPSW